MATAYDDLTEDQKAQVRARFVLDDPRAFTYGLGLTGQVLTRTPAAPAGPTAAELAALLRDIWERRASVTEQGGGYEVALDGALCERIRRALGE